QEEHRARDVLGYPIAAQRGLEGDRCLVVRVHGTRRIRQGETARDRMDADAARTELGSEGTNKGVERGLGRNLGQESFVAAPGEGARDGHHAAALAPEHRGGDALSRVEDRLELVAHLAFEIRPYVVNEGPMPKVDMGVRD